VQAPGMMRKLPNFSANLFETLMLFLLDVEDDPLWHQVQGCFSLLMTCYK
jgi:hypothetical protein